MRLAVEAWAPEYGSPTEEGGFTPQDPPVLDLELAPRDWEPLSPSGAPVGTVYFVDGVQRIEASVVVTLDGGEVRRGRCVSYGAGVVRCDGRATVVEAQARHEFLAPDRAAQDIPTRHGPFTHYGVTSDDSGVLAKALHDRMADLEAEVARSAAPGADDLLITDGPLSGRRHGVKHAVGYVKTHPVAYLPEDLSQRVVTALLPGQRTPVFRLGAGRPAWYVRLPTPIDHGWSGVVRCEAEDEVSGPELFALADRVTATLPRFASEGHKDPRAPQNLYPIGGLEKELKRRLGDPHLWFRALREAALRPDP